jgi:hypothetical protein
MYRTWNGLQYMRSMPSPRDWMNRRNRKLLLLFETCDSIVGRILQSVSFRTVVCNPVCSSSINVELHWLLYMVSRVFRRCILLTIIHTGGGFKSVTLCCTCHAVLSFSTYVCCDVPTTFFSVFKYWRHTHSSIYTGGVFSDDSTNLCDTKTVWTDVQHKTHITYGSWVNTE